MFLSATDDPASSDLVLWGLPFDGTSTYLRGSRFGPAHVRQASDSLETFSPYQNRCLTNVSFCDLGDLDLPPDNSDETGQIIKKQTRKLLKEKKKIIAIGGEHSVSLPLITAYYEEFPSLQIIQFDAHADLREDYQDERYSHATVMRRVIELVGHQNVYQLGVRSGTKEEFALGQASPHFNPFNLDQLDQYLELIGKRPIYLTLDLDVLDPAVLPGTGCPEPGGLDFTTLLNAMLKLKDFHLVGADVTELNPQNDLSGCSAIAAAKIIRELLLLMSAE